MRFHDGRGFPSQNHRKRKSPVVLSDHTWCYHLSYLLLDKTTYLDLYAWGFILNIAFDTGRRYLVVLLQDFWDLVSISGLCLFNSVWKRMHVLLFALVWLSVLLHKWSNCVDVFLAVWRPVWCRIWLIFHISNSFVLNWWITTQIDEWKTMLTI